MSDPISRRVRVETGIDLGVLEWGDVSRGHTVLLIHGFLDLAWGFAPLVEAGLEDHFHVVAADMRGHGDSDRIGAGGYYYFMDYIADVASLVDIIAPKRLSIVGHSMGGSVAAYYTGAFPDRVSRLALLEGLGPPEDSGPLPERTANWIQAWRRARRESPRAYSSIAEAADRLQKHDALLSRELALFFAEHGTRELPGGRRQFRHDPLHVTRGPTHSGWTPPRASGVPYAVRCST